jgi:hypothetical protein
MDVITRLLDPNLFYSRFSFFESDKNAINIKSKMMKGSFGLPSLKAKYNTRSPLMKALVPKPSEGTCRIMFNIYKSPQNKKLPLIASMNKMNHNSQREGKSADLLNKSAVVGRNTTKFFKSNQDPNVSQGNVLQDYGARYDSVKKVSNCASKYIFRLIQLC